MQQQQAGAMPSLAAQLSAAMVSSGFLEMFNQQHQQQHQAQQQAAAAASQANSGGGPLGGFPVSSKYPRVMSVFFACERTGASPKMVWE